MPRPHSRFAITKFDRLMLAIGACVGFVLCFYPSHSILASILVGIPMGIGGNGLALFLWKLMLPDGVELPDLLNISHKQRYWMLAVIFFSIAYAFWQARNQGAFDLLCMTLFTAEFGAIIGYAFFRNHSA